MHACRGLYRRRGVEKSPPCTCMAHANLAVLRLPFTAGRCARAQLDVGSMFVRQGLTCLGWEVAGRWREGGVKAGV